MVTLGSDVPRMSTEPWIEANIHSTVHRNRLADVHIHTFTHTRTLAYAYIYVKFPVFRGCNNYRVKRVALWAQIEYFWSIEWHPLLKRHRRIDSYCAESLQAFSSPTYIGDPQLVYFIWLFVIKSLVWIRHAYFQRPQNECNQPRCVNRIIWNDGFDLLLHLL